MDIRNSLLPLAFLVLAACEVGTGTTDSTEPAVINDLPDTVTSIAAPFQNLEMVVLLPEDNCYWYSHTGPVETTLLPLRTTQGRPICVKREEAAPVQ
jgi:hypothetical protein